MRAHSFERTPVPHDTQGRSPCTSLENAAHTGTSVSQYGCVFQCGRRAIRINGTRPRVRNSLCGWCSCTNFLADLQRHHPHRCEPRVKVTPLVKSH
ncbi:unnamed protein product, partial [Staurois parvus]